MEAKATLRYIRISPRKVSILCDLIRGKSVAQASAILALTPKAAAEPLAKLVKSAAANAENNHGMDPEVPDKYLTKMVGSQHLAERKSLSHVPDRLHDMDPALK